VLNRVPIAWQVFIAPSVIILLMVGIITVAELALQRQQGAFLRVVGGSFKTSTATTKLLLGIAEVHSDVMRYAQLRQRVPEGDAALLKMSQSIEGGYARVDKLFSEIKASAKGESDTISNITDFLTIHRAVARRILTGAPPTTITISTLLAHYQQLQSYVVELASRTLESAQATEAESSRYVEKVSRYLLYGALALILISIAVTYYVGRAISRPISALVDSLRQIVGGNFVVSVPGSDRRDEIGSMARAVEVFSAVSRELREKSAQLEIASQHKSQFLASMSHELRTPLNAILGFNEMMLDGLCGEVPEGFKDPLNETQKSGKHLLGLINNVLDLAKIEAGRMELALGDYVVPDTVESVRASLRPLAEAKGLELLANVPPDLPLAFGDSGRLTQCLMNLTGNSLKFTRQGKVEIAVAQQGGLLRYSVTDTGIGIPPEKVGSLFTEFKQTDATIASEYGGTGLGLSITKKFVEMHGGRIWVESEVGKGSAFIFEIPLRVRQ